MANLSIMESSRRRKATGPRSKMGCKTCRIRRVKCDEAKPNCNKCSRTGRECEWYSQEEWIHETPDSVVASRSVSRSISPTTRGLASCSPQELRSYEFFRTRTTPQLAGSFPSEFWSTFLPRSTQHHATLWHAVVALGSIHERFEADDLSVFASNIDSELGGFALKQYTTALSELTKPVRGGNRQDVDVFLAACILFTSFEIMRGHHESALTHVKSGIKIIGELQDASTPIGSSLSMVTLSTNPSIPIDALTAPFIRLDSQVCELQSTAGRFPILQPTHHHEPGFGPIIPPKFTSILEARNCYDYLYNDAIHKASDESASFTSPSIDESLPLSLATRTAIWRLHLWKAPFDACAADLDPTDTASQALADLLRVKHLAASHLFDTSTVGPETKWDRHTNDFYDIVAAASRIATTTPVGRKTISLDAGIVLPLFNTAWKCRISSLRREALAILASRPRQEGVWDGELSARVGKRIMEVEEEGFGEILDPADLPDWARVIEVNIRFELGQRRAVWSYSRRDRESGDVLHTVEEIAW
ncbi:hypothetical protein BT63DRAFT_425330 [Microthyrium microscopicum]|uniref:Zn(2)-C6 fungal-type domain-containing protein n=1 Tax=Microthyrium microscopicum TaxID=703497 RepID=A0A6A6UBL4_9PEZI|nr:hypothetical protein BT63DRAFT_425330 [Microthyrium microscopicum]